MIEWLSKMGRDRSLIFLLIGSGFFIVGVFQNLDAIIFVNNSIETTGKIIELLESYNKTEKVGGFYSYRSAYEFKDKNDKTFTFTIGHKGRVGDEVSILYKESNPQYFKINSFMGLYWGFLLNVPGGIFIIIGAFAIRSYYKDLKQNNIRSEIGKKEEIEIPQKQYSKNLVIGLVVAVVLLVIALLVDHIPKWK